MQINVDAPEQPWLNRKEAAKWLGIDRRLFQRLVTEGAFPDGVAHAKAKMWSRLDVAYAAYRLQMTPRYQQTQPSETETEAATGDPAA